MLVSCGDVRERMQQDLDTFPLPDHVELVESRSEGPPYCFAASCPNVIRDYVTTRSVNATCGGLQEAVEQWGVTDARWSINESQRNPCTMSAIRKGKEFTVSVYDASRLAPDVELSVAELEPYRAAVSISLTKPESFLDGIRGVVEYFSPLSLIPFLLVLLVAMGLTIRWFRKSRQRRQATNADEPSDASY